MLYQRLIPSLLIKGDRLVKGKQYDNYGDAGGPATTARAHNHQGADELFVCDVEAAKLGRGPNTAILNRIAEECFMPLTIGGGITSLDIAMECMDNGADKLCLNTAAMDNPDLIIAMAHRFGAQAVVIGLDVFTDKDGNRHLFDHRTGKTIPDKDPLEWMQQAIDLGSGEIRLMSVEREGMLNGYDLELFKEVREMVDVPIVLEGGAGSLDHLEQAFMAGVDGVAVGAMLVYSDANLVKIKQHMITRNCRIRA